MLNVESPGANSVLGVNLDRRPKSLSRRFSILIACIHIHRLILVCLTKAGWAPLRRCLSVLLCLLCLAHQGIALAEQESDPFLELQKRIEALEEQNRNLTQQLQETRREINPLPQFPSHSAAGSRPSAENISEPTDWLPPAHVLPLNYEQRAATFPEVNPLPVDGCPVQAGQRHHDSVMLQASWHNGLQIASEDKAFRVHIGGRTQFDNAFFATDSAVQQNINIPYGSGVDFRRARLTFDGTMYETIDWAVEYDFVNSMRVGNVTNDGYTDFDVTGLTDMWWTFTKLPILGNIRVGNQKEPIGFEHLVSSRFLPFMERSYNQDSFYGGTFNGFTPGISAFNNFGEELGLWHVGLYKPTDNVFVFNTNSGDYAATGRITMLPWYEEEGRRLLHLGFATRASSTVNSKTRFRTRDAVRSGISSTWPVPADTGTIFANHQQYLNSELVRIHGPWTLQSEYLVAFVQNGRSAEAAESVGTLTYHGGYVQILYFLTGENDNYDLGKGALDRVTPRRNALRKRGCVEQGPGAWQIGARYNYLDLNSKGIDGGVLHNMTCTLNWFLNPNMKVQLNYSATDRNTPLAGNAGDGWVHGWGLRVAHDF